MGFFQVRLLEWVAIAFSRNALESYQKPFTPTLYPYPWKNGLPQNWSLLLLQRSGKRNQDPSQQSTQSAVRRPGTPTMSAQRNWRTLGSSETEAERSRGGFQRRGRVSEVRTSLRRRVRCWSHGPACGHYSHRVMALESAESVSLQQKVRTGSKEGFSMVLVVKNLLANAGDVRDAGSIPGWGRSHGGGHGDPLQYPCLENPMDRGAWWATIHGVAKSWTQVND